MRHPAEDATVTARHQARLVAALAIAISGITAAASAQGSRAGNPAAPKLLVGTLKSSDQKLGPEKNCRLLAREGKPTEALKEATQGLTQSSKSVWLRACQLNVAVDTKKSGAEITKLAEDLLTVDPTNRLALTELVRQYDAAGN